MALGRPCGGGEPAPGATTVSGHPLSDCNAAGIDGQSRDKSQNVTGPLMRHGPNLGQVLSLPTGAEA